jgi:DNA-binding MurR/RpiR family transcriptional regulator
MDISQSTFYRCRAQQQIDCRCRYAPARGEPVQQLRATGGIGGQRAGRAAGAAAIAGADFESVARRITERFGALPKQLQRIARFALDAPEDFALGTAAQLAAMIGVQPSALVRFANAVGFDGFADLRHVFRAQLRTRPQSYRERIASLRHRAPGVTSPEAVLQSHVEQAIRELQHFPSVRGDTLERAVDLLASAPHVHLLAARRSFPVAGYLAYALSQLDRPVQLLDGIGGMNREFAARIARDDVLLAVSFRNYTGEVVEIADSCHARGVRVIAITDSALSPLARVSTLAFTLGDDGGVAFRSLVEPIVLAQALVVAVGHRLAESAGKPARDRRRAAVRARGR